MILSKEYFYENGYMTNHSDSALCRYYKTFDVDETHECTLKAKTIANTAKNAITYNITCQMIDTSNGVVVKESSVTNAIDSAELENCLKLCMN